MAALLDRLGRAAARRKWITIAAWVIAAVAVAVVAVAAGGKTVDVFSIPGAQSQQATDLLNRRFPSRAGDTAAVVFAAKPGATLRDLQLTAAIAASQTRLGALAHVTQVAGPATPGVGGAFVSHDATVGYANVQYNTKATELPADAFHQLEAAAAPARQAGLRVVYGGAVADAFNQQTTDSADAIGIVVAVVILLVAFGSVIAMSIPIGTALFGLAVGLSLIFSLAAVTDIGTVAPTLATMIGLGVGIDYSLFILTRHRQNLAAGMTVIDSIGLANGTAGQAVLFAGGTVVIAICGLALAGIPYVTWLGFTSAMVVLVMITAALTLIPALLAVAGAISSQVQRPAAPSGRGRSPTTGRRATGGSDGPGSCRGTGGPRCSPVSPSCWSSRPRCSGCASDRSTTARRRGAPPNARRTTSSARDSGRGPTVRWSSRSRSRSRAPPRRPPSSTPRWRAYPAWRRSPHPSSARVGTPLSSSSSRRQRRSPRRPRRSSTICAPACCPPR